MSSITIQGNASGTGIFTIASPNSNTNRTLDLPDNSGTILTSGSAVTVAQGGTGASTLTANNVILGNGTSAVQFVAPGTNGNVLTSNGTTWVSQAAGGGFAAGTVMLFAQTAAPTGWTKNTSTGDNSALRVVTGAASTGGSVAFTTAFASQTPTGSVSISAISGSAGATTLTTPQIPSHTHPAGQGAGGPAIGGYSGSITLGPLAQTGAAGGGGSHTHPFSFSSGTASFSGNAINLAVQYIDVIRATKD